MYNDNPHNINTETPSFDNQPGLNNTKQDPRQSIRSFYKVGNFNVASSADIDLDIGFTPKLLRIQSSSGSATCDSSTAMEKGGTKYIEYGITTTVSGDPGTMSAGDTSSIINAGGTVGNVQLLRQKGVQLNISSYSSALECNYIAIG